MVSSRLLSALRVAHHVWRRSCDFNVVAAFLVAGVLEVDLSRALLWVVVKVVELVVGVFVDVRGRGGITCRDCSRRPYEDPCLKCVFSLPLSSSKFLKLESNSFRLFFNVNRCLAKLSVAREKCPRAFDVIVEFD